MTSPKSITTRFITIFLPIVLLVAIGALFLYQNETKTSEEIIRTRETFSIEKLQEVIRNDFHTIVSDLMFLTTQAGLHAKFPNAIGQGVLLETCIPCSTSADTR